MNFSTKLIEDTLRELLEDLLERGNQEGSIKSLTYDSITKECTVVLTTFINESDNYIGFQSY